MTKLALAQHFSVFPSPISASPRPAHRKKASELRREEFQLPKADGFMVAVMAGLL